MLFNDIDNRFAYSGDLGVELSEVSTAFSVWAPCADGVELRLYRTQEDEPCEVIPLKAGADGVWRYVYPMRLDGMYYTFVYTYGDSVREGVDIYAKAAGANAKRGYIADFRRTDPTGWKDEQHVKLENPADAVIYELSVRDFSSDASSQIPPSARGKFAAFYDRYSRLPSGEPTCLGHLKKLGVTHVHLLPIYDFEGVDEEDPQSEYNWGYNPMNYNVPEGSYSRDPHDPEKRINELKKLVQALHREGIGVVMDVVYNHTYLSDGSCFDLSFPKYYYRQNEHGGYSNGSGCGNELASERTMVRKYIIDSVLWWAKEYKIDGFRFDLMAVLDITTMNETARRLREINPSVLLYGEGWTGGHSALPYELSASKNNANRTPDFGYFNDGYRDAIKGDTFMDTALGYISGNYHYRQTVISGLLGSAGWAGSPAQIINYCEAHDNLTLWDKLAVSAGGCSEEDRKKMSRLAFALVLLAQGVPFLHAGQEFLRSKPLQSGDFDHNSYKSPDSVNSLKWQQLDSNRREAEYCRGLIAFRKAHPILRMRSFEEIEKAAEVLSSADGTIALRLSREEEMLILVNPIPRAKMFELPDGEWHLHVSDIACSEAPMATYCEGVIVPPISAMVLIKKVE